MILEDLTPEVQTFVREELASGRYQTIDELLLAGLNLLASQSGSNQYQSRYAKLRQDIEVGLAEADRGELIDADVVFDRLRQKLQQQREMTSNG
jgi:antitoxin ParD1/3/4